MKDKLLSREDFRNSVFQRDGYKCLFCDCTENLDAHHIIERRLFTQPTEFGGYFISNGSSLCEEHHKQAEMTVLSCEEIREKAGIEKIILPEDFYADHQYTKWGDVILLNGMRMPGPLFYDESVQNILSKGNVLDRYTKYIKYPRTWHHPLSQGVTDDDKVLKDTSIFEGKEIVVTVKMDGENFTGYNDYCHARSIDSLNHESRNWVKTFHFNNIAYNLPETFRYCAENMFAKHSIYYDNLTTYLYGFQIWDNHKCLSWNETLEWFELLGITPVQEVYQGIYSDKIIKDLFDNLDKEKNEGLVIRIKDEFHYKDFKKSVAKLVRKDHITNGDNHWRFKKLTPNKLLE